MRVCVRTWRVRESACFLHNACMCVCIHESVCVCMSFSIATHCSDANRDLTPACNGSGFIGMWEKAVYIVPSTVTNGHDNAVRQGLVSPFLCLTSLDSVYTPTLKCAARCCMPILIQRYTKPALREVTGGRIPAEPFTENLNIPSADVLNLLSKNSENLIYNNWI